MDVTSRLSSAVGDHTQGANKELAAEIAKSGDHSATADLVNLTRTGTTALSHDAIKVLGEISLRDPGLLASHVATLAELAQDGKGVVLWESLTCLASLAEHDPALVQSYSGTFATGTTFESVVARDQSVRGLCALATGPGNADCMPVFLGVLETCPVNQLPTYAERIATVVQPADQARLVSVLEKRIRDMPNAAKLKRVMRVLESLS